MPPAATPPNQGAACGIDKPMKFHSNAKIDLVFRLIMHDNKEAFQLWLQQQQPALTDLTSLVSEPQGYTPLHVAVLMMAYELLPLILELSPNGKVRSIRPPSQSNPIQSARCSHIVIARVTECHRFIRQYCSPLRCCRSRCPDAQASTHVVSISSTRERLHSRLQQLLDAGCTPYGRDNQDTVVHLCMATNAPNHDAHRLLTLGTLLSNLQRESLCTRSEVERHCILLLTTATLHAATF